MDAGSLLRLALLALVIALMPLSWWWLRRRGADRRARLAALTALALFLTFDLVMVGSFTRLSDSGLGCPDWPGCYGQASPVGAAADIHTAQSAMPDGPVTWSKAWVEMLHRYLAMTVGVLLVVLAGASVVERRALPHSLAWPFATLGWIVVQGLFGAFTVTLKLYPAVVTAHLVGALVLLALLAIQHEAYRARPIAVAPALRRGTAVALGVLCLQVLLGGWVSTNYAVLACTGFPACNGRWWPAMDFAGGFTFLRALGRTADGGFLGFDALIAIQMAHRFVAVVAAAVLAGLAWRLWRVPALRRFGALLAALLAAQIASGLSNVVLGWPLPAALAHSGGAAALVLLLTLLLARTVGERARLPLRSGRSTSAA